MSEPRRTDRQRDTPDYSKPRCRIRMLWVYFLLAPATLAFTAILNEFEGYRIFGLNQSHTVYDYQIASVDMKVDWKMRLIEFPYSLDLIEPKEAHCGYRLSEQAFSSCINEVLNDSNPWDKLGVISRKCALQTMEKIGSPYRAEDCKFFNIPK